MKIVCCLKILSGLLTPIIAIIALYIAYQQYLINKRKLRLDLYEKRFIIFKETKNFLLKIIQDEKIATTELQIFIFSTKESRFLFENDISNLIENIVKNSKELSHLVAYFQIKNPSATQTENYEKAEIKMNLSNWFTLQYDNIEYTFEKYLDFKNL